MSNRTTLSEALKNGNVQAWLRTLRVGEGTSGENGYQLLFGGDRFAGADGILGTFDDFADHPRQHITRTMAGKSYTSSAAGAYQIIEKTWDGLVRQWGFEDFSPLSQDMAAVALTIGRGALEDILAGRFEEAVNKCGEEWASLPSSQAGQPRVAMDRIRAAYVGYGGTYGPVEVVATASTSEPASTRAPQMRIPPAEEAVLFTPQAPAAVDPPLHTPEEAVLRTPATIPSKEKAMPPFLLAAINVLSELVPKLGPLFATSEVAQRNVAAATIAVEAAKKATGAVNEQDLVEKLNENPEAREVAKAAVEAQWFQIDNSGIAAAREMNAQFGRVTTTTTKAPSGEVTVTDIRQQDFWHVPGFWISMMLLAMPFMLLADVFYIHPGSEYYSENIRTQIVTAVLMVISIIGGYWLGTSFSSSKKDSTIDSMARASNR